jgi:hypothetical protein
MSGTSILPRITLTCWRSNVADFIPSIPLSEFKKLKANQIGRLKSSEITSDGEYLFTFINPTTAYIKVRAEYLGQTGNTVGKETLEEILSDVTAVEEPPEEVRTPDTLSAVSSGIYPQLEDAVPGEVPTQEPAEV